VSRKTSRKVVEASLPNQIEMFEASHGTSYLRSLEFSSIVTVFGHEGDISTSFQGTVSSDIAFYFRFCKIKSVPSNGVISSLEGNSIREVLKF
jgi:hypothetical protein